MRNILITLILSVFTFSAFASIIGLSNHPFTMQKHIVTTEFDNYLNNGAGAGLTARYLQRINSSLNVDAAAGFTNGDRASNLRLGADLMLIPDYGRQPKVSIKGFLATESFDGDRINSFGMAPTVSKGFSFWGKEAFPYLAIPLSVNMNTEDNTYETTSALATGISGKLPFGENLVGNFAINLPMRNSYTSFVFGISLPVQ